MKACHFSFLIFLLFPISLFAEQASDIEGVWINQEKTAYIEIKITDKTLTGTIVGGSSPDINDKKDEHNPDPKLRDKKILGMTIVKGLTYTKDGKWKGGTIYDPKNGRTYRCKMHLVDKDTLDIRGYIGFSLLGRTTQWVRKPNDLD